MNNIIDIYELSPMQQGMLFHTLYDPDSGVYFEQRSCLLQGKINTTNFKKAWQQIVDRYPILRTAFYWEDLDKPLQVVAQDVELPWVEEDWSELSEVTQKTKLEEWLKSDRDRGFLITEAPLMRCAVIKLAQDKYRFIWSHHHILMDGWCNGILIKEVFSIYEALNKGETVSLESPQPYRNYIAWLQEQNQEIAENYWQENLQGFDEPTILSSAQKTGNETKELKIKIDREITAKLIAFANQNRITLNSIIQGAWALLISRYCDKNDLVFGATVSGRPPDLIGVESIVGLFINTLPVRVKLSPQLDLISYLQQIHEQQIIREQYSYSSLTDIKNWGEIPKDTPLFDSLVIFENYPISLDNLLSSSLRDFTISDLKSFEKTNYPLNLYIIPGKELSGRISYDSNLFSEDLIQQIVNSFDTILTNFANHPLSKLAEIDLLTAVEKEQLLNQSTPIKRRQFIPPTTKTVTGIISNINNDLIALITNNESFTYIELNERVNQLANHLRSLGMNGQEKSRFAPKVGICLPRDSDLIISLLAVLKIGATYIPLDPAYPAERINYIINDAKISFLITKQNIDLNTSDINNQLSIIDLEKQREVIHQQSKENLDIKIHPQDLAYVIYTSGSTGKPKGVAISHSSLLNFLYSMQVEPGIKRDDKLLAVTTISFDIAALEIYLPLITEATVILADRETTINPDILSQKIAENNITVMQATPATWQMLLDNNWSGNKQLKILCGGEALTTNLATELASCCQEIWNLYGPTETTIWSSVYKFESDKHQELNTVPIGKAIDNTQCYILDSQLNLVPSGIPGELYIGGAGLARGYLNRPDLTAEKFIPNPFIGTYHGKSLRYPRLYKTGDRVRQLPGGDIEYLGRLDNQIKIRGFRIELGEIEAALNQYPYIRRAIVIADEQNLIAYYIPKKSDDLSNSTDIRVFLKKQLPSYMIPGVIIPLESFPITPNGKIDRKALPLPETININSRDEGLFNSTNPNTPTEEILLGIWAEILNQNQIDTNANFFDLGGHSLLATRVISQIRQVFSIELPIRSLFEHPTIKELAENIETEKQRQTNSILPPAIEIIDRDGELPLSFAQQRQWFLAQLEPDNAWYNISTAVKIAGNLDIKKLQQCLDILVDRQEILRTSFMTVDGKPELVIEETSKIELTIVDLTSLTAKEKQQQAKQLQIEDAQQPFSLEKCPLMRVKLLTLDDAEYILLVSMHHIISDGWSIEVLVKEISSLYTSRSQSRGEWQFTRTEVRVGTNGNLPAQESDVAKVIQYVDYAAWERKWLQGEIKNRQLDYWQQQLGEAPIISSFPTDYSRKAEPNHTGNSYDFQISDHTTQSLKQISRHTGSTFFITIFSALALLLHRYTGNEDLVIGTPIANRNRSEIEGLIGFFVNTLALRVNLSGNPSFRDLLTRVRETALGAYAHSDLPFEQLIDNLPLQRSLSHTPLFQIMLVLQDRANHKIEIGDLDWQPLKRVTAQAKFEMTFTITETDKGLQGSIEYNQSLFTADTIHRLAGHFRTLLTSIATNPEQNISDVAILGKGELKQLLVKFNNTDNDAVIDSCIHQLFEQQASLTPNAVAVVSNEEELTYQELNHRANNWAVYLQSLGVKPETKIGLMLDRSTNMIVVLLAILKAGGCYVPLDPNYPQKRLDYILEDTQLNILLTKTKYRDKLNIDNLTVIELDINQGECHQGASPSGETLFSSRETRPTKVSHLAPLNPSVPENLAYIIYTSGSTGTPKGVAIPHRGVVRLVKNPNYVNLNETVISLQAAPISFDASTFEIWGALLNGGRVVMLADTMPSLAELAETIIKYQINTLWLTAGLFHLMVDEQLESLGNIRQLLAGGDVLSSSHIQRFLEAHPQCSLINGYGPTESTTFACCYPMNKDSEIDIDRTMIGYPISHTQLYILDNYLNPVPVGVPGELYIGGAGLARNYLNRPELTAEKFIPNPFVETYHGTSLLYKTGDLVRYLSTLKDTASHNGRIEYLGRIDSQVKIRGFRVELGEIETALSQSPDIKENVVLVTENSQGNKQLVAYIVPHNLEVNQEFQWRSFLQERLPEYLIPSIFVTLDRLPLTANSKVDRQALLDQEIILSQETESLVKPQTDIEIKLAQIWSQILGLETVSINDNFFSLGGDSILAIQIIAKANQSGLQLTPKQLFQYQTIAELAQVTTTTVVNQAEQGIVTGLVPLTPIQSWFFALNIANINHFNQSVLLKTKQDLDISILQQAIQHILIHHDALRIRFKQTDRGWQQFNQDVIQEINIPTIDLANLSAEEQRKAINQECDRLQASLDITTGSTIKIAYFNLGQNRDDRLLIIIHHLLIDGVSWRILLEDLQTAYQQQLSNKVIRLPAKTTSYKQWSEYLRDYAKDNNFKTNFNYWLSQNSAYDWSLSIESNSNNNTVASEQTITSDLNKKYTQSLLQEINQTYNTQINDILLTALVKTFAQNINKPYLLIDLEGQGRTSSNFNLDISRTIGWFTNIFPVFLDLGETADLGEQIKTIKEQLRQVQNHSFNYGVLRYLQSDREISNQLKQLPSAQISFNYLGQFDNLNSTSSLFELAQESSGLTSATNNQRSHLIAINSLVINGQLQMQWNYSQDIYHSETITNLANNFIDILEQIIIHCQSNIGGYTPSDFSLAELEQDNLDLVLDMVDFGDFDQ